MNNYEISNKIFQLLLPFSADIICYFKIQISQKKQNNDALEQKITHCFCSYESLIALP